MLKPGDVLHGFKILDCSDLPEYHSTGILAEHLQSGARVFHTINEDKENLFAFIFKTAPDSANGVSHILEHTVLCGSQRFPVKDPFVSMLKGSMQTFLNAFTYPDKTVYPASSTVPKDLFNLMDVYGDAVFFPLLREEHFRQEGHRLELDEDGKVIRTGIVFNEMKGNYSTHDSVAADWTTRSLLPDTTYGWDSGGDPAVIPQLDYETFKSFHAQNYHPSNCLIYLYGNIPTAEYFEFLDRQFLSKFQRIAPAAEIALQELWAEPRQHRVSYPASQEDQEGRRASVTLSWLLFPVEDRAKLLSMELLTDILMSSPSSPLQKLAADTELGEELSSTSGFETELRQTVFSVGLQGADEEDAEQIEQLFLEELARLAQEGLNAELVEGTIRRYEFRNREIPGGGPYGLRLLRRLARGWLHGLHPAQTLEFTPVLAQIRERLQQNPRYFEEFIDDQLLQNKHRCTLIVAPEADLLAREAESERQALDALTAGLKPQEAKRFLEDVAGKQRELVAFQESQDSQEARNTLPFLGLDDLPEKIEPIDTQQREPATLHPSLSAQSGNFFTEHDFFTNGITYSDMLFDFDGLDPDQQLLLPLWTAFVSVAGTSSQGYEETSRKLNLVSGGFYVDADSSAGFVPQGSGEEQSVLSNVSVRLKALDGNIAEALTLALELLSNADFADTEHLAEVFYELRGDFRSSLVPSGNSYALLRSQLGYHPSAVVSERLSGITQYFFLEEIALALESGGKAEKTALLLALGKALSNIGKRIIRSAGFKLNLSGEEAGRSAARKTIAAWLSKLPSAPLPAAGKQAISEAVVACTKRALSAGATAEAAGRHELWELPSKVAFAALSFPASSMDSEESVAEVLLSHNLRTGFLWEEIRMKGGAYGASASADSLSRTFGFSSYRDPHIQRTLQAFEDSLRSWQARPLDGSDLVQTKIGVLSRELRPMSPGAKGVVGFRRRIFGISDELRQWRRDLMTSLSAADLASAAQRLLAAAQKGSKAVVAGQELFDAYTASKLPSPAPVLRSLRR